MMIRGRRLLKADAGRRLRYRALLKAQLLDIPSSEQSIMEEVEELEDDSRGMTTAVRSFFGRCHDDGPPRIDLPFFVALRPPSSTIQTVCMHARGL